MIESHDAFAGADDAGSQGFSLRRMSDWLVARFQTGAAPCDEPKASDDAYVDEFQPVFSPLEEFH